MAVVLPLLRRRRVFSGESARLSDWFLASGEWDEDGMWLDSIPYPVEFFLESGGWSSRGVWVDSETWA